MANPECTTYVTNQGFRHPSCSPWMNSPINTHVTHSNTTVTTAGSAATTLPRQSFLLMASAASMGT